MFHPGFIGGPFTATRLHVHSENSVAGSVANNYTFSGVSLGTAIGTSLVVVVAYMWSSGTQPTIGSISIDGTNGTLHQAKLATNTLSFDASIAIASRATSNTSGTIITRANNGSIFGRIDVWRINRLLSATPTDSDGAQNVTPANASINLDITAPGVTIAAGATLNPNDATAPTLTGLTQDANGTHTTNSYKWVYGSNEKMSTESGRAITSVLNASGLANAMVAATWH